MTVTITIHESSCRGCGLCVNICPTQVIELDAITKRAKAPFEVDCIGCLSCAYVCPSAAIVHGELHRVKSFARDLPLTSNLGRFL